MTIKITSDGVTRDYTMLSAFTQAGTSVTVDGMAVGFSWVDSDTLRLDAAAPLGSSITITPNTAAVSSGPSGGLKLSDITAALVGIGAVQGELRVFNTSVAPAGWAEVDRVIPTPLAFTGGNRSLMCSPRALTSVTSNSHSICVAGEHSGYVYYILTPGNGYAYLERMHVATGETSAVATHPYSSFSTTAGIISSPMVAIVGDFLYSFGGRGSVVGAIVLSSTYRINLRNTAAGWAQLQSMPNAQVSAGVSVVGSRIYSVGGFTNPSSVTVTGLVQVFDTATLSWNTLAATLPFGAVDNCQVAVMPDGVNLLCVGGYSGSAEIKKYAQLNTLTGQFGAVGDLPASFYDRPRAVFHMPGSSVVNGITYDGSKFTLVEFNGVTWVNTGILARLSGNLSGNIALSDGSVFMPATLVSYILPHAKYAINAAQAVDKRLLCVKL